VASQDSVPTHISSALTTILALLLSVYELSEQRRQALPLLTSQTGVFVDIALEGTISGAPKPTLPQLQSVFEKLAELKLKEEKEKFKASSS
jgi:hypothetical protein